MKKGEYQIIFSLVKNDGRFMIPPTLCIQNDLNRINTNVDERQVSYNKISYKKYLTNHQLDYNCSKKFLIDKSSNLQKLQKTRLYKVKIRTP